MDRLERLEIKVKEMELILNGDFDILQDVVRELNSWNGCLDWLEFYENDEEFFEMYFDGNMLGLISAMKYGEYDLHDDYVKFNGYGNLDSYSYREMKEEIENCLDEIIENLIDNRNNIDVSWTSNELQELLNEYNEIEEEEEDEE